MKQRLADYVADFLANKGVTDVFSVVGGGAMHLNDAFGHHEGLKVTYNHHEQACAIAAEAYARLDNKIAAVCVTTGPGGTNAITGVLGGWLDSIPMFIVSGQVRYDTTARYALQYTGTPLRAMGDQEYDIVKSVTPMTKYAVMVEDPQTIRYVLEKAWHLATTGRPGPVWVDIPVNYQGMFIETDTLQGYCPDEDDALLPPAVDAATIETIIEKIKNAKRPVFHAGYGIRLSGAFDTFRKVLEKLDNAVTDTVFNDNAWLDKCRYWKENYPVVLPRQKEENGKTANVYAFVDYLSSRLPENSLTAVSNGACCVVGHQAYVIQKGSRFANNSAVASMGYGLPAAIGTCIGGGRKETICLEGDGSIMMNLQELQTILTNRLPIKIFMINNNGYHSIRLTQTNLFSHHCKVGIGEESGDLSFPEFKKIAEAFGYPYYSASSNAEMQKVVDQVLSQEGPVFCEIFTDTQQVWEPKSSTKRLPDGTLVSPPLEDLAPFLPREELKEQMFIPMMEQ